MKKVDQDHSSDLISKVFSGEATPEELKEFSEWLNRSEENRAFYHEMKNIWEASARVLHPEEIDTGKALKKVLDTISESEKEPKKIITLSLLRKIAAAIFIPLLIASYFIGKNSSVSNERSMVMKEVTAAPGTRASISLEDGTTVWLNSGSSLKYPEKFGRERKVLLSGEGYFEVESDKSHPFIVETGDFDITATGTRFNVLSSETASVFEVTLLEGNVDVAKNTGDRKNISLATLKPDQHLVYNLKNETFVLDDTDPYRYISWKDGKLIFRNDRMIDVVQKISQYYNVELELRDEELTSYRYRATFDNESLDEILTMLKLSSPIDYYEEERSLKADGTFTKRKIVIFSKK